MSLTEETTSDVHQSPSPISSILFPSNTVLATSTHKNSTVHLWSLPNQAPPNAAQPVCLQSIAFKSEKKEFLGHLSFDPCGNFLFLASVNMCVGFIIHLDAAGGRGGAHYNKDKDNRIYTPKFDYLTEFEVTQPILSFTVGLQTASQHPKADSAEAERKEREYIMQLFCVQTKAIQIHQTSTEHCYTTGKQAQEDDTSGPLTQTGKVGEQLSVESEFDISRTRPPLSTSGEARERMAGYDQHQQNLWLSHSVEVRRDSYAPEEQYQDPMFSPSSTPQILPSPAHQLESLSTQDPSMTSPSTQQTPARQAPHDRASSEQHAQPPEQSHEKPPRQPQEEQPHDEQSHEQSHYEQPHSEQHGGQPHGGQPHDEHPSTPSHQQSNKQTYEHSQTHDHEQLHLDLSGPHEHPHEQNEQASMQVNEQHHLDPEQPGQASLDQPPESLQSRNYLQAGAEHQGHEKHQQHGVQSDSTTKTLGQDDKFSQSNHPELPVQPASQITTPQSQASKANKRGSRKNNTALGASNPNDASLAQDIVAQPRQQQTTHTQKQKAAPVAPQVSILHRNPQPATSPQKEDTVARTMSPASSSPSSPVVQDDLRRFEANMVASISIWIYLLSPISFCFISLTSKEMERLFVQQLDRQYVRLDKERLERERLEKERQERLLAVVSVISPLSSHIIL